ncbi:hypothetical protein RS030_3494 [Cryptosporidium xiaoi]|uniref:Uncharacterized protein n=1 Tax=Cryptosporidium xiaoi TaxID=659607 RepID=A0AAV9XYW4_9CRYT
MRIEDSVVVVTGGLSGLGNAVVNKMLEENPKRVCLMDYNVVEEDVNDENSVGVCDKYFVDVTKYESINNAVKKIIKKYGRIDIVVHCAGITHCQTPIIQKDDNGEILDNNEDIPEIWGRVININLMGTLNLVHCLSPNLARNKSKLCNSGVVEQYHEKGVFVLVSSSTARDGSSHNQGYISSKGGINSITLPLARELGPYGIRVVTIAPGIFETPMSKQVMDENISSKLLKSIPLGRFGLPDEFAQVVIDVCIKCEYISGEIIYLDGGWRSQFMKHYNMKRLSIQNSSSNDEYE